MKPWYVCLSLLSQNKPALLIEEQLWMDGYKLPDPLQSVIYMQPKLAM